MANLALFTFYSRVPPFTWISGVKYQNLYLR